MKIKKGFVLRKVGGESVVVPVGEMSKQFHGMINLNETGAFLCLPVTYLSPAKKFLREAKSLSEGWSARAMASF